MSRHVAGLTVVLFTITTSCTATTQPRFDPPETPPPPTNTYVVQTLQPSLVATDSPVATDTQSPSLTPPPSAPVSIFEASSIAVLNRWEAAVSFASGWSPGSDRYAIAFHNENQDRLAVYDTASHELLWQIDIHPYVSAIDFSPDGNHLAIVSAPSGPLLLLDAHTGSTILEYTDDHSCDSSGEEIAFTPDMRMLYWLDSGGRGTSFYTWIYRMRIPEGICGSIHKFLRGYLHGFYIMASGERLVTSMQDVFSPTSVNWVYVWDAADGNLVCHFKGLSPAADPEAGVFLVESPEGVTQVVDVDNCEIVHEVQVDGDIIAFDYSKSAIVTQSASGLEIASIDIVDLMTGRVARRLSLSGSSVEIEVSPDWRYILGTNYYTNPEVVLYAGQ